MHIGLSLTFQNYQGSRPDHEVWAQEVRLTKRAIALGFDGIWATEHHFTDYEITPDPLQFLSYVAGLDSAIGLGTMAVILPWHDPVRVAEQISVLDTISEGRLTLAIGRGLGKIEFEGLRVPMEESRERFVESAEIVLEALDTGILRYEGKHYTIPERRLRPAPSRSFRSRTYAAALSPESFEIMARLQVGMLLFAFKSWDIVAQDMAGYREAFQAINGADAPAPLTNAFVICDRDRGRARELAHRYIRNYYGAVLEHYGFTRHAFADTKGYEHYARLSQEMQDPQVIEDFVEAQVFGTPKDCLERVAWIREQVATETFLPVFGYGGLPDADAERSMDLFAAEVMPGLQALGPSASRRRLGSRA
jgi:alkanesulfonate monooxygenase SsuD/methylene tetrahydromethanopterin reductase-like flavin-dependent oxidoreductase (luciferase family)